MGASSEAGPGSTVASGDGWDGPRVQGSGVTAVSVASTQEDAPPVRHAGRPSTLATLAIVTSGLLAGAQIAAAQDQSPSPAAPDQSMTPASSPPPMSANTSVFATGLDNPRGLVFGPDGDLYVAEGGTGGTTSTQGQCDQVVAPVGPYTSGMTARISRIDSSGAVTTVVDGLPSSRTSAQEGGLVSGVSSVAFVDGTLYRDLAGVGCSHGVADVPNGVFKVNDDSSTSLVADVSAFVQAHPVAQPNAGDFEPDETTYSMIADGGMLYLGNPNHGEIDTVDPSSGDIARLIDASASEGHVVPTAIAMGPDGDFRVGNLARFPVVAGDANIHKVTPDGRISTETTGLTAVTGLQYVDGQLYALEASGQPADPLQSPIVPFSGRVVRVNDDGSLTDVATGLMFPTAMTVGSDGNLYTSDFGFGGPPGAGQIVKVDMSAPLPDMNG
jgi:hypothetical protein